MPKPLPTVMTFFKMLQESGWDISVHVIPGLSWVNCSTHKERQRAGTPDGEGKEITKAKRKPCASISNDNELISSRLE